MNIWSSFSGFAAIGWYTVEYPPSMIGCLEGELDIFGLLPSLLVLLGLLRLSLVVPEALLGGCEVVVVVALLL